jgi:hypothetical protein
MHLFSFAAFPAQVPRHRWAVPALLAAGLLSGCASHAIERRQAALAPMVGQTEADLVRQLGVPTRVFETGGQRFLSYDEQQVSVTPGFPGYYGPWGPWGPYSGMPPTIMQWACETTFDIASNRVQSFTVRGNGC